VILPTTERRRWPFEDSSAGAMSQVLHLSSGRATLRHPQGDKLAKAPDVLWVPSGAARAIELEAGSAGVLIGVSNSLLAASIGQPPEAEAAPLRELSAHIGIFDAHEPALRDELSHSLLALEAEARNDIGNSWHLLVAHVTIVLVMLWRMAGRHHAQHPAPAAVDERLQRFRQLVEANFREHWAMAKYASALAISADRLHDLCVRQLGRTPITLVHQRLAREACLLLSGSNQSIEGLSVDLGFASASHFSRFFKRWMNMGPKAYRDHARAQAITGQNAPSGQFQEWP
jgi:AraC family transcriptional regulator, transcriptional activator of pobA